MRGVALDHPEPHRSREKRARSHAWHHLTTQVAQTGAGCLPCHQQQHEVIGMVAAPTRGMAAEALGGPQGGAYRSPSVGMNGVVSAAHGLAATAGLRIMMEGGNAIDAAVAVGAALGVVEPFMSGLGGGGGFMLFHEGKTGHVHGLDYIGLPPAATNPSVFSSIEQIGKDVRSSTVPGTLGGWLTALGRFGTMDRAAIFKPAI